MRWAKFLL